MPRDDTYLHTYCCVSLEDITLNKFHHTCRSSGWGSLRALGGIGELRLHELAIILGGKKSTSLLQTTPARVGLVCLCVCQCAGLTGVACPTMDELIDRCLNVSIYLSHVCVCMCGMCMFMISLSRLYVCAWERESGGERERLCKCVRWWWVLY